MTKTQPAPVMRRQAKEAVGQRVDPAIDQCLQAQEVATRFGHPGGIKCQEMAVHPEIGQPRAVARLRLRDLVAVMHCDVIFTAAVNVEPRAQISGHHGNIRSTVKSCRDASIPLSRTNAKRRYRYANPLLERARRDFYTRTRSALTDDECHFSTSTTGISR